MGVRDTSRDNGSIGVSVCPFGESVCDEADSSNKAHENRETRHTRSRTHHVIRGHTICGYLDSVHSRCCVGAQNLAIQGKTERPLLIVHLSNHPTIVPAHSLRRATIPNLTISPGIPHPLIKIAPFRPFWTCWYGSTSRVALKTAIKPDS
jgi:hypothetical protein